MLAETDVINMVSRGISAANILKGIHDSMAERLVALLKGIGAFEGIVLVTGGLAPTPASSRRSRRRPPRAGCASR